MRGVDGRALGLLALALDAGPVGTLANGPGFGRLLGAPLEPRRTRARASSGVDQLGAPPGVAGRAGG
jgi:hypothetical protein